MSEARVSHRRDAPWIVYFGTCAFRADETLVGDRSSWQNLASHALTAARKMNARKMLCFACTKHTFLCEICFCVVGLSVATRLPLGYQLPLGGRAWLGWAWLGRRLAQLDSSQLGTARLRLGLGSARLGAARLELGLGSARLGNLFASPTQAPH